MNEFTIRETLPTLNEVISAERSNRYVGANLRKKSEQLITRYIEDAKLRGTLKPVREPCEIIIEHHEANRRKDADNLQIRAKMILDSLVRSEILIDDNRRHVRNVIHTIYDSDEDYVRVLIVKNVKISFDYEVENEVRPEAMQNV